MDNIARRLNQNSLFKFLFGGAVTVTVEYGVFYMLYIYMKWPLLLANSLSFCCGLAVSYGFNRQWAFKKDEFKRAAHHQVALYVALAITNLVFNNLIVGGLKVMGLDARIGKIIAILIIATWNFLIYTYVIFKEKSEQL